MTLGLASRYLQSLLRFCRSFAHGVAILLDIPLTAYCMSVRSWDMYIALATFALNIVACSGVRLFPSNGAHSLVPGVESDLELESMSNDSSMNCPCLESASY